MLNPHEIGRQQNQFGIRIFQMPYEYAEYEKEPVPEPSSARSGGPPGKLTGIGALDPPIPPPSPSSPVYLESIFRQVVVFPLPFILRIFAAVLLFGIAALAIFTLLSLR